MDEKKVRRIAQEVFDQNTDTREFSVANVGYHTHSGTDSLKVNFLNLLNKILVTPYTLFGTQAATVGNYSVFFTAPFPCTLSSATEVHTIAGSDTGSVFLQVEKLTGTIAPGGGLSLLIPISSITTAIVSAGGSGYVVNDTITLTGGTATVQAVLKVLTVSAGSVLTVSITNAGSYTVFPANPVAQGSSSGIGTGATFNITYANNGFNLKGTANTVQTGILVSTTGYLQLKKGDRLGLKLSGTPTAVANVTVVLTLTY